MRVIEEEEQKKMSPPQLAAVTAVGASALAFGVKLWLAGLSGLASVSAAAWHAVAGLLYALLMLGILYSPEESEQETEDELSQAEREYLHYQQGVKVNIKRYEAVLALFGSAALLGVAYWVFNKVLGAGSPTPRHVTVTLLLLVVVFFVTQFLSRFTYRIGLEHSSPGLVASSFHARTDGFATLLAGAGVILASMGFGVERFVAALIGLLLVADAAQLFVDATRRLVGLEEDTPTAQLPFWVRLRDALRIYAEHMPPIIRWLLRYEDAMTPAELRSARRWAGGVLLVAYLCSGFKTVRLGEVGGYKFLGAYKRLVEPGPCYALWPFASVRIAPVDRVQRVTVGFRLKEGVVWSSHKENRPFGEMLWASGSHEENQLLVIDSQQSKFMLGDTTQVETHVALTYSVQHAKVMNYLFGIEDPEKLVQRATRQAIQEVMGTRSLDQVIVEKRHDVEASVAAKVQAVMDLLDTGITVENCLIRSIHPPVEVLDAFVDVASALEDKERDINLANSYRQQVIETAKGNAERQINVAESERVRRIGEARGQTSEFRQLLAAASADPEAVTARLGIESMERLLEGRKKVILPRSAGRGRATLWFSSQPPPTTTGGAAIGPAGEPVTQPSTAGEEGTPPPSPPTGSEATTAEGAAAQPGS